MAEELRVSAEEVRVSAGELRVSAGEVRVSAGEVRVLAEELRVSTEEVRVLAEEDSLQHCLSSHHVELLGEWFQTSFLSQVTNMRIIKLAQKTTFMGQTSSLHTIRQCQ